MRLSFYSLRTGLLLNLVVLVVSAMLLINVVMVKFSERDLIRSRVEAGRFLVDVISRDLSRLLGRKEIDLTGICAAEPFRDEIVRLISRGGFSKITLVDRRGRPVFTAGLGNARATPADIASAVNSLQTGARSVEFEGKAWAVIWPGHREIRISAPIAAGGVRLAGLTVGTSLLGLYQTLRMSEKWILLYVLLDTVVLVVAGMYLLSRSVVRPIDKLVRMTDSYMEGEFSPPVDEAARNEIGNLSRSLAVMLRRLEENKKELRFHIASLEKANQELKQAQEELIRSEKLASVGRLAAGVAHEIGNPLGIVLGYIELLRKGNFSEEERNDFLGRIEPELTRINRIIRGLLDFSRPSTGNPEECSVHKVLEETAAMLQDQPVMTGIGMDLALDASDDIILADPNRLKQVFLNILMNAADAHKEAAPPRSDRDGRISIRSENEKGLVRVRFEDNGPGIPRENLERIFDPFFTTKEPGRGTGLGLAVSYRIIEDLKGSIRAESTPGKGTTMTINLPLYSRS